MSDQLQMEWDRLEYEIEEWRASGWVKLHGVEWQDRARADEALDWFEARVAADGTRPVRVRLTFGGRTGAMIAMYRPDTGIRSPRTAITSTSRPGLTLT